MKYIITENKLRNFIKKTFNIDLTGKVKMITSVFDFPNDFFDYFTTDTLKKMLNQRGPMYLIDLGESKFLLQDNGDRIYIFYIKGSEGYVIPERTLFKLLGIEPIMSIFDLIDAYLEEE